MLHYLSLRARPGMVRSGIFIMLLSVIFYVAGDILIKGRLKELPSNEVVFFRNLFGLLFLLAAPAGKPLILVGRRFWLLASRGALGFLSLSMFYYLLMHAPLANAVVFLQSSTIFSALIAYAAARDRLTAAQVAGTVTGFAGICLIVHPQIGGTVYDLLGIALGIVFALANTSIQKLKKHYDSRSIVFSNLAVGALLPLLFSIAGHIIRLPSVEFLTAPFVWPDTTALPYLAGVAILTTLGQLYKTKAYALDKAGVIGTIGYSRVVFALAAGVLLGDALPGVATLAGIALVTVAAVMVSYRNKSV